ncbi:MAG: asparagine synthase [Rhodobacteraceae bacterium]|nr:asparagine synthase [Paracoccaceae bacterium]
MPNSVFAAYNGEVYRDDHLNVPEGGAGEVSAIFRTEPVAAVDGMYSVLRRPEDSGLIEIRRDPFGIKPLYMREGGNTLGFSSELAPLLQGFGKVKIRRAAIAQFLALGRPIDGLGFFEGIRQIPPGHAYTVDDGQLRLDGRVDVRDMIVAAARKPPPTVQAVRTAIREAVETTLVSNRRVGLAISGGLDSTILASELAAIGVTGLDLISVRMQGAEDGITDIAELGLTGNAWRTWRMNSAEFQPADYPNYLRRAIAVLSEPTQMTSAPLYLRLAEQASDAGVTVLMLGEGADELFCGYRSYLPLLNQWNLRDFLFRPLEYKMARALLSPSALAEVEASIDTYIAGLPGRTDWEKLRAAEIGHNLLPLLNRADHTLMHKSIEGRTPFLHGNVAELAFRLPIDELLCGNQTKVFLRQAFREDLPQFMKEKKQPFRAPIASWFAGPLADWLQAELERGMDVFEALGLNRDGLRGIIRATLEGDASMAKISFCMLTLSIWIDTLIARGVLDEPDIVAAHRQPIDTVI